MRTPSIGDAIRAAAGAVVLGGALGACHDVFAPLPRDAVRFAPPPEYARWWALTEACSRRNADFAAYTWYVVPGHSITTAHWGDVAAYTDIDAHRIVLSAESRDDGHVVRHGILHALLGHEYASGDLARVHPPAYFQGRCAGVVECLDRGCREAGPAPVNAPADAPTLPPSALDLQVEILGN